MRKALTEASARPLSFDQRLTRVRNEIKTRVSQQPAQQQHATQARLWCRWINRNVLEVTR